MLKGRFAWRDWKTLKTSVFGPEALAERESVLRQIEAGWQRQTRRPTADEIDVWISQGRK